MELDKIHELREMLYRALLDEARNGQSRGLNKADLDLYDKLTHTIKNLDKIIQREEGGGYSREDGYSRNEGYSRNDGYSRNYSRNNGYSRYDGYSGDYSGRRHRDSRGRYSRADGMEEISQQIQQMMSDNGLGDRERSVLARAMDELRNM